MKKKSRMVLVLSFILICTFTPSMVFAHSINTDVTSTNETQESVVTIYKDMRATHEIEAELMDQRVALPLDAQLNPNDWKVEWGSVKKQTFKGYAGNQPTKDTKFPTGGGFYYSDAGGPTVTLSVAFPSPYGTMKVSATLGNSAKSGRWVEVPTKTAYYKLYVEKVYEVKPYITYQKVNGKWKKYTSGSNQSLYSVTASAKKQ